MKRVFVSTSTAARGAQNHRSQQSGRFARECFQEAGERFPERVLHYILPAAYVPATAHKALGRFGRCQNQWDCAR